METAQGDVLRRTYFHGGVDFRRVPFCVQGYTVGRQSGAAVEAGAGVPFCVQGYTVGKQSGAAEAGAGVPFCVPGAEVPLLRPNQSDAPYTGYSRRRSYERSAGRGARSGAEGVGEGGGGPMWCHDGEVPPPPRAAGKAGHITPGAVGLLASSSDRIP